MTTWAILAGAIAATLAVEVILAARMIDSPGGWSFGMDFDYYRSLGAQWLVDGSYYRSHQLEGPYVPGLLAQAPTVDNLYPPSALFLFVPFTILPAFLWWALPLAITGWVVRSLSPSPWTWPVMLACLAWPRALGALMFGNTDMWVMAFVAAGIRSGWPALFATLKPPMALFALIGADRRSWWVVLASMMGVVALSLDLWIDYIKVVMNGSIPIGYSLGSVPLVAIPVVAWMGQSAANEWAASQRSSSP